MSENTVDPARHMVSTRTHFWDEERPVSRAVTFAEMVAEFRGSLVGDTGESASATRAQTLVAAGMLQEFAARLRLSISTGLIDGEAKELVAAVEELSDRLRYPGRI